MEVVTLAESLNFLLHAIFYWVEPLEIFLCARVRLVVIVCKFSIYLYRVGDEPFEVAGIVLWAPYEMLDCKRQHEIILTRRPCASRVECILLNELRNLLIMILYQMLQFEKGEGESETDDEDRKDRTNQCIHCCLASYVQRGHGRTKHIEFLQELRHDARLIRLVIG